MKKWSLMLILLLTGCSAGGLDTVGELYEKTEVVQETISKDVVVHTVVGTGEGEVIAFDEKSKWVEVDAKLVSQHPLALVEASNEKLYKAQLVGIDDSGQKAYLKVKSSLALDEEIDAVDPDTLDDHFTYKERLALKERFADVKGKPSEKIVDYDELVFTKNLDEVEAFIYSFEQAKNKEPFIANDLLVATLEEASASDIRYTLQKIEAVAVGKTGITVVGEIEFIDAQKTKTKGQITYTVTKIANEFKIINMQLSE